MVESRHPAAVSPAAPARRNGPPARPRAEGLPAYAAEPWRDPSAVPFIRIENLTKTFDGVPAVDRVSLDIYQGELFALLGASGSGKTTLLRLLAGFERPDSGRILIDGIDMSAVPPYRRPVNLMFQSYALFPHMTVAQNIAFGLKQERLGRKEIRARLHEMLALVQLEGYERRKPHQLSGGQRQRVALARALAKRPKVLLLDEPLAALDRRLREQTQFELLRIQDRLGTTFVIVTHDQEEAMTLATRIGVMERGGLVQVGTPLDVYEYPASRFVAEFIGSVNLFAGHVVAAEAGHTVIASQDTGGDIRVAQAIEAAPGTPCWVALRPEKIRLARERPHGEGRNCAHGRIDEIAYRGSISLYALTLDSGKTVQVTRSNLHRRHAHDLTWDEEVWLSWDAASAVVLLT